MSSGSMVLRALASRSNSSVSSQTTKSTLRLVITTPSYLMGIFTSR